MKLYVAARAPKNIFVTSRRAFVVGYELRVATMGESHDAADAVSILQVDTGAERDWLVTKLNEMKFVAPLAPTVLEG